MNMTIEELEAYLLDHYSNGGVDQSLFMKLAEEIGEVAEVLKKRIGPAANSKECFAFFPGDLQRCGVISYYIKMPYRLTAIYKGNLYFTHKFQ